jgi:hypothetical protein
MLRETYRHDGKGDGMSSFIRKYAATISAALLTAAVVATPPVAAHVTKNVKHAWKHLQPLADARYELKGTPTNWSSIQGVPGGFADGVDNAGISQAELDAHRGSGDHDGRYYTENELNTSDGSGPNAGSNRIHWDNLGGAPGGLADGTDANSGQVMVRWGNATQPAGTTLLYSGLAFGSHNTHTESGSLCVRSNDAGAATGGNTGDLLYPSGTGAAGFLPPGITAARHIRCAVFLPSGPTLELWGSWTGPAGWTELYRGYALGSHYTQSGGTSTRHCVDNVSFDATLADSTGGDLWYGTSIFSAPTGEAYTSATYVKCSVWMLAP